MTASCTTAIKALIHTSPKQYRNHRLHAATDCGAAQRSDRHRLDLCTATVDAVPHPSAEAYGSYTWSVTHFLVTLPYYKLVTSSHFNPGCRNCVSKGQNPRLQCYLFLEQRVIRFGWKLQTEMHCTYGCRSGNPGNLLLAWPPSAKRWIVQKAGKPSALRLIPLPLEHQGIDPLVHNPL